MVLASPTVREIERATLPNGIRIVTEAMPYVRSVSLGVWIGSGSRIEHGPENGISHFIEHMLFKGTMKQGSDQSKQAQEQGQKSTYCSGSARSGCRNGPTRSG